MISLVLSSNREKLRDLMELVAGFIKLEFLFVMYRKIRGVW